MTWTFIDTWIVITAALCSMACALLGNFLVLRKMSMMGDALSHTMLPGIAMAYLATHGLVQLGWIDQATFQSVKHAAMFGGAVVLGVLTALLTQVIHRLGRVEAGAALGVVFTTLFAIGLVLIRLAADQVDLDPDCVLYGSIETTVLDTVAIAGWHVPQDAIVNASMLLANLAVVVVFYKELKICAFDPSLATAQGVRADLMHYLLMAVVAATLVAAFESVGSILVIAMLIVPPATAYLLTDRLAVMIGLSLAAAAAAAVLGHIAAITLPGLVFGRLLNVPSVTDASTAGMIAVAAGGLFAMATLLSPRHGLVSKWRHRASLNLRILGEDVIGLLYRLEELKERAAAVPASAGSIQRFVGTGPVTGGLVLWRLRRSGQVTATPHGYELTEAGRSEARRVLRSHRLWEAYLAQHLNLPLDHLHAPAERLEHITDAAMRQGLAEATDHPEQDPHGKVMPADEPR